MLPFIVFYVASAYSVYLYVHLSHSKGGIFEGEKPSDGDVYLTLMPGMNTLFGVIMWLSQWPLREIEKPEKDKRPNDHSKFFRVKK